MELVCIISLYWSFTLGQKGTVVEKLTEETLRDWNHFKELLSICIGTYFPNMYSINTFSVLVTSFTKYHPIIAAQRQIGETALNEVSSRSHQILRLVRHSADLV